MQFPNKKLEGNELDEFLKESNLFLMTKIENHFSKYEPTNLYHNWSLLLRSIDEFINLQYEIDDAATREEFFELSFNLTDITEFKKFMIVHEKINIQFGEAAARRFFQFSYMIHDSSIKYEKKGYTALWSVDFSHGESAILYFQSKRKFYVTILDLIPVWAKGQLKPEYTDTLIQFQHIIDACLQNITTIYYDTILKNTLNNFYIDFRVMPPVQSHRYYNLEGFFLEPQILSMQDQLEFRYEQTETTQLIEMPDNKIFSFIEAENNILMTSSIFEKYKINKTAEYIELSFLVQKLKYFCSDDFNICVPKDIFKDEIEPYIKKVKIFLTCNDYVHASNFVSLFQLVDNVYYTSVVLLNRFVTNRIQLPLNKNKSFQINSGFVFEDKVKRILEQKGFHVTDITRIKRKEFDVITLKNNKIYNFQCKNNFIDISRLQEDPLMMARLNNKLIKKYIKAHRKELEREKLVTDKLNINEIEHFVVSRYPVISEIDYIINFNKLEKFIDSRFS